MSSVHSSRGEGRRWMWRLWGGKKWDVRHVNEAVCRRDRCWSNNVSDKNAAEEPDWPLQTRQERMSFVSWSPLRAWVNRWQEAKRWETVHCMLGEFLWDCCHCLCMKHTGRQANLNTRQSECWPVEISISTHDLMYRNSNSLDHESDALEVPLQSEGPTSMICDITNSWEALNLCSTCTAVTRVKWGFQWGCCTFFFPQKQRQIHIRELSRMP